MEPKSKHHALVGYDDGSKSVLYYNADTCKVLTSRNFQFLDPSLATLEHILIIPGDVVCKGEPEGGTQNIVSVDQPVAGPSTPWKRPADKELEESMTR